ncbi:MAG TPA: 50S ribosomal protein L13 [Bacteroidota bacterium]|jgi:large subunit ribosomal protein L13|nr:50S ribosomal protein L13 [Bacteroidota bacterium]
MSNRTTQRTFQAKEIEVDKKWYVVDAEGLVLGRLAAKVAHILRGKHKPIFSPHVDTGDFVIVINAGKVNLTGKRQEQKSYFTYSGYPGGDKTRMFKDLIKSNPRYVIEHAVRGMLPHNRLGRRIIKKLKVYADGNHPHQAQQPEVLSLD